MAREITYIFYGVEAGNTSSVVAEHRLNSRYLDGLFISGERAIVADGRVRNAEPVSLLEARDSSGEWLGVFAAGEESDDYRVASDPFGYQLVFYRQVISGGSHEPALIISNSFRALCNQAKKMGDENEPNAGQVAAVLGTDHAWGITMQSDSTFEQETRALLPGQEIVISNGKWEIADFGMFESKRLSYDALLEKGIKKAVAQLRRAVELPVDQRRINLSGGRDSRMAMALMDAAGVTDFFSVTTVNPATWTPAGARPGLYRDLHVSNTIREAYGLKWSDPMDSNRIWLDFEHSLEFWQSYRSHKNFRFRASKFIDGQIGTNIEVRGAAGETFRGFQAVRSLRSYPGFEDTSSSFEHDVDLLCQELYDDRPLSTFYSDAAKAEVRGLLGRLGGETITEALHRRYSIFRNRSHFGHVRASMALGQIPVFPLSQPEFVQAASLLCESERYDNTVAFDLIERTSPDLTTLEFDSGAWPTTPRFIPTSKRTWSVKDSGVGLDEFFEVQSEFQAKLKARSGQPGASVFDARFKSLNLIKEILVKLQDSHSLFPYNSQVKLLQEIEGKRLNPFTILGKLRSIEESLGEFGGHDAVVVEPPKSMRESLELALPNFAQVAVGESQPTFRVNLSTGPGSVDVFVSAYGNVRGPLSYEFLLLRDGKILDKVASGRSGEARFEGLEAGREHRIQVLAYYRRVQMVPFKFYSRYFKLAKLEQ